MAVRIRYADGNTELLPGAVNVDYNDQEDTYDFCDDNGQPMKQLVMETGVTWAYVDDSESPKTEEGVH